MTKKKEMRIKDVGATINLGNYSSLHVTIGESSEYAGLELQRATDYLKAIAAQVGGVLNLPDTAKKVEKKTEQKEVPQTPLGKKIMAFGSALPVWYDHESHTYTDENGKSLMSVTQFVGQYYPFNDSIAAEYMDFAAAYGNLIHTAIQNAVIGKPPKKGLIKEIVDEAMAAIGKTDEQYVESLIVSPEDGLAGRFDILTRLQNVTTLWDVKTNSDIFLKTPNCTLPPVAVEYLQDYWNPYCIFGEHSLQLNLYAYMIEKTTARKIDDIKIIHVPDGFNRVYPVQRVDVEKLLGLLRG